MISITAYMYILSYLVFILKAQGPNYCARRLINISLLNTLFMSMISLRCYGHTLSLVLNIVWSYGPEIRPRVQFITIFWCTIITAIVEMLDSLLPLLFIAATIAYVGVLLVLQYGPSCKVLHNSLGMMDVALF